MNPGKLLCCVARSVRFYGDGIPGELFQILKDDAVKVLHSICYRKGEAPLQGPKSGLLSNTRK